MQKKKNKFVNVVKNEMQSLGVVKVEFVFVAKMAKRNEDGETTHFDNYKKNETWVFQNENDRREKVMEFMDEINNRIENYIENRLEIILKTADERVISGIFFNLRQKLRQLSWASQQKVPLHGKHHWAKERATNTG